MNTMPKFQSDDFGIANISGSVFLIVLSRRQLYFTLVFFSLDG